MPDGLGLGKEGFFQHKNFAQAQNCLLLRFIFYSKVQFSIAVSPFRKHNVVG